MTPSSAPPSLEQALRTHCVFRDEAGNAALRRAVRAGALRVHQGSAMFWEDTWPAWFVDRLAYAVRAIASARSCASPPILTGPAAAVLLDLPTLTRGHRIDQIVTHRPGLRQLAPIGSAPAGVVRRIQYRRRPDSTEKYGVLVVDPLELAADMARTEHPRDALCTIDAIVGRLARPDRRNREASEERMAATQRTALDCFEASGWRHGRARAESVLHWATGWAESPGESAARWALLALGFRNPLCQYPVAYSEQDGRSRYSVMAYLDLYLHDEDIGVEVDGDVKYAAGDRSILIKEKRREDGIRREVPKFVRLSFLDSLQIDRVAGRLRPFLAQFEKRRLRQRKILLPNYSTLPRTSTR